MRSSAFGTNARSRAREILIVYQPFSGPPTISPGSAVRSTAVWRLIVALKQYRPDLEIHTIATAPTGLGLIRRLDPTSTVLADNLDRIVAEMSALPCATLDGNKDAALNFFPNEWRRIAELFAST